MIDFRLVSGGALLMLGQAVQSIPALGEIPALAASVGGVGLLIWIAVRLTLELEKVRNYHADQNERMRKEHAEEAREWRAEVRALAEVNRDLRDEIRIMNGRDRG